MSNLDIQFIVPEIILMGAAIVVLATGLMAVHPHARGDESNKRLPGLLALLGVTAALFSLSCASGVAGSFFYGMLVNDGLAVFFRTISLLIAGLVILLSMEYKDLDDDERGEYYFFILVITLSMMLASASRSLVMIYITLEAISLLSYILAGYLKRDMFSSEAGLKYFLFGALSTGVTLYGISLVYGLFGTLDLASIAASLVAHAASQPAALLAFLLVLAGFGFKCSLVPFHMWTPDVYQGAPTPAAAFFSVGPKAIGFVFILRVFVQTLQPALAAYWPFVLAVMAALTMTIGNVIAIRQDNIKRLLAYSTIAQAGYILIGLAAGTAAGVQAVLFYLFIYMLMNLGAFAAVVVVSNTIKTEMVAGYVGLYKRAPFLAVVLAAALLSLAGMPPSAGFLAKFFVFAAAVEKGLIGLVIVAALNSVVALYYYLRIIKVSFFNEPEENAAIPSSRGMTLTLSLILSAILFLGLWPHPVIHWLENLLRPV